ncbi:MAG: hypothetical protein ACOCV2_05985 [Persicimonas sp.]
MTRRTPLGTLTTVALLTSALAFGPLGCGEADEEDPDEEGVTIGDETYERDLEFTELDSHEKSEVCEWFREGLQARWDECPNDPTPQECSFIIPAVEECSASLRVRNFESCRDDAEELACAEAPGAAEGCSSLDLCLTSEFWGECGSEDVKASPSFGDGPHCYTECTNHDQCLDEERCTATDAQGQETVCAPEDAVETSD